MLRTIAWRASQRRRLPNTRGPQPFVGPAIAVVVYPIARIGGARSDRWIAIIAIVAHGRFPRCCGARRNCNRCFRPRRRAVVIVVDIAAFVDVRWGRQVDVFSGSEHESDAKEFDTRGVAFAAIKPR
jgi:hypothetical protein